MNVLLPHGVGNWSSLNIHYWTNSQPFQENVSCVGQPCLERCMYIATFVTHWQKYLGSKNNFLYKVQHMKIIDISVFRVDLTMVKRHTRILSTLIHSVAQLCQLVYMFIQMSKHSYYRGSLNISCDALTRTLCALITNRCCAVLTKFPCVTAVQLFNLLAKPLIWHLQLN